MGDYANARLAGYKKGYPLGARGHIGTFSFSRAEQLATGGSGTVIGGNDRLAAELNEP